MSNKKCCFLVRSTFLRIASELKYREKNTKYYRILLVQAHRNTWILTPKGQFENITLGQIKRPDLTNDPIRIYCMSVDASWQDKQRHLAHGSTLILWEVIDVNVSWLTMASDMGMTQNCLDSIQLGLRKLWFDSTHDSQLLCKNWFKSAHNSKWISEIWLKSTHDSKSFQHIFIQINSLLKKHCRILIQIDSWLKLCRILIRSGYDSMIRINCWFRWPFWASLNFVDLFWAFDSSALTWSSSWLNSILKTWIDSTHDSSGFPGIDSESTHDSSGLPRYRFILTHDSKCFPIFRFKSAHDSIEKHLILRRLIIRLWVIPMSGWRHITCTGVTG